MSPTFRIALRFLTAKRRAMAMSLSCIVLGVGLFIITQATTSGFEEYFIRAILGTDGALRVEDKLQRTQRIMKTSYNAPLFEVSQKDGVRYVEGIEDASSILPTVQQFPNVAATSVVLHGPATIRSAVRNESGRIYGINLDDQLKVSDLAKQIVEGRLIDFRDEKGTVLIGRELAQRLQLSVGDSFEIVVEGESHRYRIAAFFETGVSDIDRVRIFMHLSEARSVLKKPTGASFIQVNLYDKDRAVQDAEHMQEVLGYKVRAWQDREHVWLSVFKALRMSSAITVSVFTLIAGLAMFNTLAMIVMEKTKDIAILRSMGYTRRDISSIFIWQAVIVLMIGSVLGVLLGAVGTFVVSKVPLNIETIIKTSHYVVSWSAWHYVLAVLISIVMVMVASLVPSRRAARLEPGDVIRGTGQ